MQHAFAASTWGFITLFFQAQIKHAVCVVYVAALGPNMVLKLYKISKPGYHYII